ncbi:MAG: cytochrome c oxidase subunit I [Gammaproteobacteria bacterium]|nr:cytochrome c oxidase subunit I [Gammaproteobacteria bacterium]
MLDAAAAERTRGSSTTSEVAESYHGDRALATAVSLTQRLESIWSDPPNLYGALATIDHKKIGKRYLATAFVFLLVGGIEAVLMRIQLAGPDADILSAEAYNQIMSMHGTTMIFWYASPILAGFGNYLVPMLIGARDMAFPRLNAFSYWTFLLSGVLLYIAPLLGMAPRAGWFAFAPFTETEFSPGLHMDFFSFALILLTVSTTAGAINFIATILRLRAPGMSIDRMPLFLWSTMTTSFVVVFSLPALTAALVFLELDRLFGFRFYDAGGAGDPLLWQQLFWIFGHPWVYIIFLPATGMISMILPVFSRRPIVGYTWVALATVLTGLVGFGVWVHHMFATGLPYVSMGFFSAASMTISIFTIIQVFAWLATVWTGRPVIATPMLFALGFIFLLVIGGLSGVMTAVIPLDWQVHDTYFVVGHIHFVLIGANVFPVFAAFYYWLPKMTGRLMDERLGRWNFWLMFAGMMIGFWTMHITGFLGMPRRVFTYGADSGWTLVNAITTGGSVLFAIGVLVGVYNFFHSRRHGAPAGPNPWNADSLEWSSSSPPPVYGVEHIPTVTSRHPLWDAHEEEADPGNERVLDERKETLATSTVDAIDGFVARMPDESLLPLIASLLLFGLFLAFIWKLLWVVVLLSLATAVAAAFWMWPEEKELTS